MHKNFASVPPQAIRGRLAGIYPTKADTQWTRASADYFLGLVSNKTLVAQVHRVDEAVINSLSINVKYTLSMK